MDLVLIWRQPTVPSPALPAASSWANRSHQGLLSSLTHHSRMSATLVAEVRVSIIGRFRFVLLFDQHFANGLFFPVPDRIFKRRKKVARLVPSSSCFSGTLLPPFFVARTRFASRAICIAGSLCMGGGTRGSQSIRGGPGGGLPLFRCLKSRRSG